LFAQPAAVAPRLAALVPEDGGLGPGADVQPVVVDGEGVDLVDARLLTGARPLRAAVVPVDAAALVPLLAGAERVAGADGQRQQPRAGATAVGPGAAAVVPVDALVVERDRVQLALIDGHPVHRVHLFGAPIDVAAGGLAIGRRSRRRP